MKRGGRGLALALAWVGLSGCCSHPPAEEYFDLGTPFNTLNAFAYAVRCGQWDFACQCVSTEDRVDHEITPFRIQIALMVSEHPRYGIPVRDIIERAQRSRQFRLSDPDAAEQVYVVWFEGETGDGIDIQYPLKVYLVNEGDQERELWRIRFEKTIRGAF